MKAMPFFIFKNFGKYILYQKMLCNIVLEVGMGSLPACDFLLNGGKGAIKTVTLCSLESGASFFCLWKQVIPTKRSNVTLNLIRIEAMNQCLCLLPYISALLFMFLRYWFYPTCKDFGNF